MSYGHRIRVVVPLAEREGVEPSSVGFGDPGPRRRALCDSSRSLKWMGTGESNPEPSGSEPAALPVAPVPNLSRASPRSDGWRRKLEVRVSSTVPTARTQSARRSEGREPDVSGGSSRNRTLRGESRRGYSPARLHSDLTILVSVFLLGASGANRTHSCGGCNPVPSHLATEAMSWSAQRDSHPRPSRWRRDALSPELCALMSGTAGGIRTLTNRVRSAGL